MQDHTRLRGAALLLLLIASTLGASLASAAERDEIYARMKERYPILRELKQSGVIGETHLGFVAVRTVEGAEKADVKADAKVDAVKLVAQENADREALYSLLAERTGETPEAVGKANAARIFGKADDDEFFRSEAGKWRRKSDYKTESDG